MFISILFSILPKSGARCEKEILSESGVFEHWITLVCMLHVGILQWLGARQAGRHDDRNINSGWVRYSLGAECSASF